MLARALLILAGLAKLYCGFADSFGFGTDYISYAVDFAFVIVLASCAAVFAQHAATKIICVSTSALCYLQLMVHAITTDNPSTGATNPAVWACIFSIGVIAWSVRRWVKHRKTMNQ